MTVFLSDPQEVITVKQGEDVTLECWSSTDAAVELLKWKRSELKPYYMFYYREQCSYEKYQHPSYKGRVELRDPDMKNGDVSVILKSVAFSDAGSYECEVITGRTEVRQRSISLRVEQPPEDPDGGSTTGGGWRVTQVAAAAITVVVAILSILLITAITFSLTTQISR